MTRRTQMHRTICRRCLRLIRPYRRTPKDRHHDQPATRELVIANNGVTVVLRFTRTTEALKDRIRDDRPVEDLPRLGIFLTSLGKYRHAGVHDLNDVVRPNCKRIVRWISKVSRALRSRKPDAKPVETLGDRRRRPRTLNFLLNILRSLAKNAPDERKQYSACDQVSHSVFGGQRDSKPLRKNRKPSVSGDAATEMSQIASRRCITLIDLTSEEHPIC